MTKGDLAFAFVAQSLWKNLPLIMRMAELVLDGHKGIFLIVIL